ncbi:transposase [Piscirickettsia salmonis]|nr:transposase [Piscirickettsia salmonis]WGZ72975.1 transposase [Piscirickettsia salmonis EM-90]PEQ16036.1 transposase [Piscirickettsia salmonis]QHS34012.1 transposase [Piscirickettsia salmonis]QHS34015.1 transposase [Piscirickettsia salmonis]
MARGELLRKEGLYSSRISTWKKERETGKLGGKYKNKSDKKMKLLSQENIRLKKKLAQAEAIIDLQKKVSDLLGEHILPTELSESN